MECPQCRSECACDWQACRACGLVFEKWVESKWKRRIRHPRRARPASKTLAAGGALLLCLFAGLGVARRLAPRPEPIFGYRDALGAARRLGAGRPALAAFWRENDPASTRLLRTFTALRKKYKPEELDMVAFCLDDLSDAQLLRAAASRDWTVTLAALRRSPQALERFAVSGAGREVFIVDGTGRTQTVPLGAGMELQSEVELALWREVPKLRNVSRSGLVTPVPGT